ncbi:hypothetical protein [Leptospira stimsonii]|uniref:hypothetical protein n=1 Tax=Leptospira stimsonii TaxID=2202203 RepID=UPI0011C472DE|nr:hypothetical protein [Leptospira stimsonii]
MNLGVGVSDLIVSGGWGARRNAVVANFHANNEAQIRAVAYQNDRHHRRKSFYESLQYFRFRITLNFALWRNVPETSIP